MKKRTGCVDSLSDKESDRTRQKFPALSLTNVLALGPGFRVHWLLLPPSIPSIPSLPTAMMHIHILTAYGLCTLIRLQAIYLCAS
jgi:hypothetical protein